jgi:hypothetical protein
MVAALPTTVRAADETLTLACQGTVTDTTTLLYGKPEPISVGIIINFTAKTVQGLNFMTRSIQGLVGPKDFVKITSISDQTVAFLGSSSGLSINGSIDRVTGDLEATYISSGVGEWTQSTSVTQTLALKCRPAQRMF